MYAIIKPCCMTNININFHINFNIYICYTRVQLFNLCFFDKIKYIIKKEVVFHEKIARLQILVYRR